MKKATTRVVIIALFAFVLGSNAIHQLSSNKGLFD